MSDLRDNLKNEFQDPDYRYAYAESFLNTKIASQIKALREQRGKKQAEIGATIGTKQSGFSRFEDVNHSVWKTDTLWKIARALDVRLNISFETFGSLIKEKERFTKKELERPEFKKDPVFTEAEHGPVREIEEQADEKPDATALSQYEAALSGFRSRYSLSQTAEYWVGQSGQYGAPEPKKDPENTPPLSSQVVIDTVNNLLNMVSSGRLTPRPLSNATEIHSIRDIQNPSNSISEQILKSPSAAA